MTMTLNIPAGAVQAAMKRAGTDSPEEAVAKALAAFTENLGPSQTISEADGPRSIIPRPRSQADLIPLLGTSDGFMTPEALQEMRETE